MGWMGFELVRKRRQGGAEKHHGPVRVLARASTRHLDRPPLKAGDVVAIGAALGEPAACIRQRAQPEKAGSALRRALLSQVTHDAGGVADAAPGGGLHSYDPATEDETAPSYAFPVERDIPRLRCREPGAVVTAEEDCGCR